MQNTLYVCSYVCFIRFVQDTELLQQVWEITQEWNANWDIWKVAQLSTLQTESMGSTAQDLLKKLQKLQRELKVSSIGDAIRYFKL